MGHPAPPVEGDGHILSFGCSGVWFRSREQRARNNVCQKKNSVIARDIKSVIYKKNKGCRKSLYNSELIKILNSVWAQICKNANTTVYMLIYQIFLEDTNFFWKTNSNLSLFAFKRKHFCLFTKKKIINFSLKIRNFPDFYPSCLAK